jgi:hypothetical protein
MSLSDSRHGPTHLSRVVGWLAATGPDLPCCVIVPLLACHRHYPGGTGPAQLPGLPDMVFPYVQEGRLPRRTFSRPARRSLALWPANSLSCLTQPFDIKDSRLFVASRSASTASRWPVPFWMGLALIGTTTPSHGVLYNCIKYGSGRQVEGREERGILYRAVPGG